MIFLALAADPLLADLRVLAAGFDGRVGICVREAGRSVSVRGGERFPLQSVMKLAVAAATLDAVDREDLRRDGAIVVRRKDLSLNVQPLAEIVRREGSFRTTVGDLVARAVIQSDSAATDVLWARLGGAPVVRAFLRRRGIAGVRVDRDERHLQTELVGLRWRAAYLDPAALDQAIATVPDARRAAAFAAARRDPRDTATPEGMALFLDRLAAGRLLSPSSTAYLLSVMRRTSTGPGRLRAGAPEGWVVGHKTGTGGSWRGVASATNDVGVLTFGGRVVAIAVFVADSRRSVGEREAAIAAVARLAARRR